MALRLISEQDTPAPSKRRAPTLTVIEGTPAPAEPDREWHRTKTGQLLPRTGRWERITLHRHQSTKEWRALADALDAATDHIAETGGSDEALAEWRRVAAKALAARWGNAAAVNASNMRTRIALAAVMAGIPFEHGLCFSLTKETPPALVAFALLDHGAFRLAWKLSEERRP